MKSQYAQIPNKWPLNDHLSFHFVQKYEAVRGGWTMPEEAKVGREGQAAERETEG